MTGTVPRRRAPCVAIAADVASPRDDGGGRTAPTRRGTPSLRRESLCDESVAIFWLSTWHVMQADEEAER